MNFLKNYAAIIGATTTAIGGVLYVFLSIISSWVYSPLGITPSQVGLGYGPLLIRAAVLLFWIGLTGAIVVGLTLFAAWLSAKPGRRWLLGALLAMVALIALVAWDAATAALAAAVPLAAVVGWRWPRRRYLVSALVGAIFAVLVGVGSISWWALRAGDDIEAGHGTSGAWSGPWAAQVVSVRPTESSSSLRFPSNHCLLYLGEANGMSAWDDSGNSTDGEGERTWRVPTAGLVIEIYSHAIGVDDCDK